MGYITRQLYVLILGGCLAVAGFFGIAHDGSSVPVAHAQSTVQSIKIKIAEVVSRVDGKITLATKNRLIEVISARIKTSYNPVIIDIYVFFLREVKKLRTSDEIVPIGTVTTTPTSTAPTTTTTAPTVGPDFAVTFATIPGTVQIDQKFATLTIKIKNLGTVYTSDGLGSLKFGCKGIDGTLYPYRSYLETAPPIATNGEVTLEVPNVYIGNLTSNVGFKLLVCKIDSSNLVTETNEDNNFVNVTVQVNE